MTGFVEEAAVRQKGDRPTHDGNIRTLLGRSILFLGYTRIVITLVLAGWCSILPVFAQACSCSSETNVAKVASETGQPEKKAQLLEKSCCGHCFAKPASLSNESVPDQNNGHSWPCRCDQITSPQLFVAQVSESDVSPLDAGQSLFILTDCFAAAPRTWIKVNTPPPFVLPHQRKLSQLGVWRL